jgi:hypothetical protein
MPLPEDRCSQVNHEVRNGISAVIVYARQMSRKAKEYGLTDLVAFDPDMEKTITRLEKALSICNGCHAAFNSKE